MTLPSLKETKVSMRNYLFGIGGARLEALGWKPQDEAEATAILLMTRSARWRSRMQVGGMAKSMR